MAELLGAIEQELTTDFAMLSVPQADNPASGLIPHFAVSEPAAITLQCGSKYAEVSIRVERWSARPAPLDGFEDWDELPFEALSHAGPMRAIGFDDGGPGDDTLDVNGLGRARASILARGRHAFDEHEQTQEQWLVRLWPDRDDLDAMAGGPRQVMSRAGYPLRGRPPTVIDADELSSEQAAVIKYKTLQAHYRYLVDEIQHYVEWAPGQVLFTDATTLGLRLAAPPEDVLGAAEFLTLKNQRVTSSVDLAGHRLTDVFELRRVALPGETR